MNENVEAMEEILLNNGVSISLDVIEIIVKDYDLHLSCIQDMLSYQYINNNDKCNECIIKDDEIKDLKDTIEIYRNSVKNRRNASHVYVDKHLKKSNV